MHDDFLMTTSDVARTLDLSEERVRQLDDVLLPNRLLGSRHRRYSVSRVAEVKAQRATR